MLTADIIPSHKVAQWLLSHIHRFLNWFGLEKDRVTEEFLYTAIIVIAALFIGWAIGNLVRMIVRKWVKVRRPELAQELVQKHVIVHCCRIIPPLVILGLLPFAFTGHSIINTIIMRGLLIYTSIVVCMAICSVSSFTWARLEEKRNTRNLPLRGILDTIIGILWVITVIVCVAILVNRSPVALLTGLGAFAAVLMLVFKDSILGLVAGVQLSENDSLHVGDWIKVNGTDANGTVMEVNLTSVVVLNWDKTTTTLPPYSLISGSFTNYRSMQQSNTRRICRSYMIDADSILPSTPQMLDNIRKVPFMDDYITRKLAQQAAGHVADVDNPEGLVDGSLDTNLGLFRAYMKMWLDANPCIAHDSDCFVSTLPQTATGIPFQVYCFTSTSKWFPYEAIQDGVFEHLASMLRFFQLYTFENPSGRDTVVDGYLSPGGDIDLVYGVPYPFFQSPTAPDGPASTRTVPKRAPKITASPDAPQDAVS